MPSFCSAPSMAGLLDYYSKRESQFHGTSAENLQKYMGRSCKIFHFRQKQANYLRDSMEALKLY